MTASHETTVKAPLAGESTSAPHAKAARLARKVADPAVTNLARQIASLREERKLTLQQLADHSGVSRAMLSKIERAEKSPTLAIISRIAQGLDISLSALIGARPDPAKTAVVRKADRVIFKDPITGFDRELLSPNHIDNGVELLLHEIPAGKSSGILPVYSTATEKYLTVYRGTLTVLIGEDRFVLAEGDSLYFEVTQPYRFVNEANDICSYYMVVVRQR